VLNTTLLKGSERASGSDHTPARVQFSVSLAGQRHGLRLRATHVSQVPLTHSCHSVHELCSVPGLSSVLGCRDDCLLLRILTS
jgi:hypothetical protein